MLLKRVIKEAGITQVCFYNELGITKPYFHDIVSGKSNPPPPELQIKIADILCLNGESRCDFFDCAARYRKEIPADIGIIIADHPSILMDIRKLYGGNSHE